MTDEVMTMNNKNICIIYQCKDLPEEHILKKS